MKKQVFPALLALMGAMLFPPRPTEGRILPRKSTLRNGVVLLTSEQRALPMVTISLLIEAGSRFEPAGKEGLAHLTARLLTYGTRNRTAVEISELLDFIGADIAASSSEELATISVTILKKDLDVGLGLLAEMLTEASFPVEEIQSQKQSIVAQIKANEERPGWVAQNKLNEILFPGSAYGRPAEGSTASLEHISQNDLSDFYFRFYRPDRAILAVVGDVSHKEISPKLEKSLASWKPGGMVVSPPSLSLPSPERRVQISRDLTQANIVIGHRGVPRSDPDYYAIQVMNYILGGGGFSSRLMDSVRNERGLAYSVYSSFDAQKYIGTFQIGMQTKNETAGEAITIAREEIRRMREQKVTQEELEAAKDYLTGSFPLRFDTNRRIADFLAYAEFFQLGLDYMDRYPDLIRRVDLDGVLRVARAYLRPDDLALVVVGKEGAADSTK